MRFYNNHDGKIYREIEEYINNFYFECKTCVKDTAVTIRFPNGLDETYLFIDSLVFLKPNNSLMLLSTFLKCSFPRTSNVLS